MAKFMIQEVWELNGQSVNTPVFGGPFDTQQEAKEEMKHHEPEHGGYLRVINEDEEESPRRLKRITSRR
jgi:hypothetical protein